MRQGGNGMKDKYREKYLKVHGEEPPGEHRSERPSPAGVATDPVTSPASSLSSFSAEEERSLFAAMPAIWVTFIAGLHEARRPAARRVYFECVQAGILKGRAAERATKPEAAPQLTDKAQVDAVMRILRDAGNPSAGTYLVPPRPPEDDSAAKKQARELVATLPKEPATAGGVR